jgi:cytochrome c
MRTKHLNRVDPDMSEVRSVVAPASPIAGAGTGHDGAGAKASDNNTESLQMVRLMKRPGLFAAGFLAAGGLLLGLPAAAAGDPAHGKQVFAQQCAMCHSAAKGAAAIIGPTLFGVVGRPAASVPGFNYSSAMKAAGYAWSDDHLRTYLPAPRAVVPGTKMTFAGLKNPAQVDDIVAYLNTLK